MGNSIFPKLICGYLWCNRIPTQCFFLRQPWPIWAKGVGACRCTSESLQ